MFLIAGITGNVGGAAARALLAAGQSIRALVRDPHKAAAWAAQGVDVRQGDLSDPTAVTAALEGVEGAFLMMPPTLTPSPDYSEAKAVIAAYQKALGQTPTPRLALLSSFGSEQDHGIGLIMSTHLMEQALGDLPFPTVFLRAGSFIENAVHSLGTAASTGIYFSFLQPLGRAIPMTATADIGTEIARLLMDGWDGKKIVEIGSPLSPNDLADAMGKVLGKPVTAQAVPRERWAATLASFGMPSGSTGLYEEMMEGCNSGWIDFGRPGTEPVDGTTGPAQVFAQAQKA